MRTSWRRWPDSAATLLLAALCAAGSAGARGEATRAAGPDALLVVDGLDEAASPPAAVPSSLPVLSGGRRFHVDSRAGDDDLDGLAPSTESAARGPWRSLARAARGRLRAGDVLVLACGSLWRETLRLPASGRAGAPIVVRAAEGCAAQPPVIDGAVPVAPDAWRSEGAGRWSAPLAAPGLALHSASRVWNEAHHPNRGNAAAPTSPSSPWLLLAGGGERTALTVARDLALPSDAARAGLAAGARVRVRVNSWLIEESPVAGHDAAAGRITLARALSYPAEAGWGWLLLGQRWMLDSEGEWWHDAAAGRLWVHSGAAPPGETLMASTLAAAIDLRERAFVVVDGVALRHAGSGADLRGSREVVLRNSRIEDMADHGVDAAGSRGARIEANLIARSGADAVSGWRFPFTPPAERLVVRGNVVRASGVLFADGRPARPPRRSYAAIMAGAQAVVSGNTVVDAGYIGIRVEAGSLVADNVIAGACAVLDDCAGIYVLGADNRSTIRGNLVIAGRGAPLGKPAREVATQAQGLYLDESASGVLVERNVLVDNDHGIHLHMASNNRLAGNLLYANRRSQIWLQASRAGAVVGNAIEGNQIAPARAQAETLRFESAAGLPIPFAQVRDNRVLEPAAAWGAPRIEGASVVPAGPYTSWYAAPPRAQLTRERCAAGDCWRSVAGGGSGLVSTPNFAVQEGQWYRLSVDIAAGEEERTGQAGRTDQASEARQGGLPLTLLLRRGGPLRYDALAPRVPLVAQREWRRHSALLRAGASVKAGDAATGELGARIDIEGLPTGRTLRIAGLELVPVAPDALAAQSVAFVNAGPAERSWPCPFDGRRAAWCGRLRRLDDGRPVRWPLAVPPRSAVVVHGQASAVADADGDGIADLDDACPATPARSAVDARGCPLVLQPPR
jgi:parallel beta-helix repeat protein